MRAARSIDFGNWITRPGCEAERVLGLSASLQPDNLSDGGTARSLFSLSD